MGHICIEETDNIYLIDLGTPPAPSAESGKAWGQQRRQYIEITSEKTGCAKSKPVHCYYNTQKLLCVAQL